MMTNLGKLYGLSVGPGDPELITVKALNILQRVAIIASPAGINGQIGIASNIVKQWLQPSQVQLPLDFPYVQDENILTQAWQDAAHQVFVYLNQGQDVAFVCEGDVSFYSTFTYLAAAMQKLYPQVDIETVAGVCSPMATASVLGIPLTIRSQKLAILPVMYDVQELSTALDWAEVVILMKVRAVYQEVWQILKARNLLDHAYVVEKSTWPDQVIYDHLGDRPQLQLSYFSLMLIQVPE
jgi:precorrin-2/cobalt-factor-2 C20-methyltransferase